MPDMTLAEQAVRDRYSAAAQQREAALCCPVDYPSDLLKVIPTEILERDYGCGDPSPYLRSGDTVLDLGSGAGKLCYIAAQIVGGSGRVIGVDCNQQMLELARRYQNQVADQLGFDNVSFRCGMIQDLQLDLELLASSLDRPGEPGVAGILEQRATEQRLRAEQPMVPDHSVDCVVSNCVLNLVRQPDRRQLFEEVFRVLKRGGRAAISDIVSDETVPDRLKTDGELWSGCISGAWREDEFLDAFAQAGFHGMEVVKRQIEPWQIIEGIEFRSVTVVAYKGKQGPCLERHQGVIYRGPFKKVEDDDGHIYHRGIRSAVCDKTFHLLQADPYGSDFIPIAPYAEVPLDDAQPFNCRRSALRHPRETKGLDYSVTTDSTGDCGPNGPCC